MNNESSTCHQPSIITVDSMSYKELQSLAMSLSLPGKMKQGVLVEAIKARQNNNEEAVAMILEANRQRKLLRREQYLRTQQQQLAKVKDEKDVDANNNNNNADTNHANGLNRSQLKRSASEMEMDPSYLVDEDIYKRSKLAAALIQQPRQQQFRGSASFSFTSLPTGAIRKDHQQYQTLTGGCNTWEQQQQQPANHSIVGLPSLQAIIPMMQQQQQKGLPVLSKKELSILPALSDCSSGGSGVHSNVCCSVSSAANSVNCWKSGCNGSDISQSLPQSSFESCDSGWMGADDSYDLTTWKNLQNIKMNSNNNNNSFENTVPPPSLHTPPNSSSGYFDATAAPDTLINSGDIYTPDDFTHADNNNNNSSSVTANGHANFNADFPLPLESSNSFQDVNVKQEPSCSSSSSTWCEAFVQQTQSFQQHQPQFQSKSQQSIGPNAGGGGRNGLVCCSMSAETRVTPKNCPYDFDCYRMGGPFFRIQRPGNPTPVIVVSGRSSTRTTFCNMLPRIASYVQ